MTKITLSVQDYNKLMEFGKRYTAKNDTRPALNYIRMDVEEHAVAASITDGYKAAKVRVPLGHGSEVDNPTFLLPVSSKLKKSLPLVIIEAEDDEVSIITPLGKSTTRIWDCKPVDIGRFFPEESPNEEIYFNAKLLSDALAAFGDTPVKLGYFAPGLPITVTTAGGVSAIVLPIVPKKKW